MRIITRSPFLFRVNTGSCNGCDVELATTAMIPRYDVERLGCRYTGTPKHADILLVTGPITARSKKYLLRVLDEIPNPFVVVAIGTCAVSCGIFRDSYAIEGPLDKYIEVDVYVPGCPPRPQAIIDGVAKAIEIWKEKIIKLV
jgi:Ni,Fe-hydrogenase III small subunit